jgi:peptidoglycan hydrolase-like protein with peptidoglycan-binding domain
MKNITFTLVTMIIVGLCIAIGYLALSWMRNPADYINQDSTQIGDLINIQTDDTANSDLVEPPASPLVSNEPTPTAPVVADGKNATLIANLQKALSANMVLKVGSRGDSVKAVQEFLNLYFKTTTRADGDFGKGTETNYKKFQAAEKLPQTGQVGTQGFTRMIEWLQNN